MDARFGNWYATNPGAKQKTCEELVESKGDREITRQLVVQVKNDIKKCLDVCMTKEQMFQELCKKGIHLEIAYAVYKELRRQNHDFFKTYYWKIDANRQIELYNNLVVQYTKLLNKGKMPNPNIPNHGGFHPDASASGLQTLLATLQQATIPLPGATQPVAIPDMAQFSDWSRFSQPGSSRGVHDFDGWTPWQTTTHLQVMQHAHHLQQSLPHAAPLRLSMPGLSNAIGANSWPPWLPGPWYGEQAVSPEELEPEQPVSPQELLPDSKCAWLLDLNQLPILPGAEQQMNNQRLYLNQPPVLPGDRRGATGQSNRPQL